MRLTNVEQALAGAGIDTLYSYAGRTGAPAGQPVPIRIGGFGGAAGLAAVLRTGGFTHLVDATHPFAARISANAVIAAAEAGVPLLGFERPAWTPVPGDRWTAVPDTAAAAAALPADPASVFLAIGRQDLHAFAGRPRHRYLLRLVDPPDGPLPLPGAVAVIARGPFDAAADRALMTAHGVELLVARNAGGAGARAKLDAARSLGIPVILIARPALPARACATSVAAVMRWLHGAAPGADAPRGV